MFTKRLFHDSNDPPAFLMPYKSLFILSAFLSSSWLVTASPVARQLSIANEVELERRQDAPPQSSGISRQVLIPVVIVLAVLVIIGVSTWGRRRYRASRRGVSTVTPVTTTGARELTAEQLAGTINTGNATAAATTTAGGRTRRARRPRRTPSQMSVTDLPEYNKEPGELELVIIRGADSEDVQASTVARAIPEEDDDSLESEEQTRGSAYSPIPNNEPSQHDFTPSSDTTGHTLPRGAPPHSSRETTGLLDANNRSLQEEIDERGEAPPYFEVIDPATLPTLNETDLQQPTSATTASSSIPSATLTTPPSSPERRRSGIRTFFNRMSVAGAPRGFTHVRGNSSVSSDNSHVDSRSATSPGQPSSSRHRTTPSGSSFFRTISRQKSQSTLHSGGASARLNSPSLISLNSISAPLTYTAVRTEFTYPKAGPTPEQLKMISSRESIGRFAVPYGSAAIAYASNSRLDLSAPPPDFDTAMSSSSRMNASSTSLHVRNDSSGQWRAPSPSPLAQLASPNASDEPSTSSRSQAHASSSNPSPSAEVSSSTSGTDATVSGQADGEIQSNPEQSIASKYKALPYSDATLVSRTAASRSANTTSQPSVAVDEFGLKISNPSTGVPPSSFHLTADGTVSSATSTRTESRASVRSHQTFETAAESLASRRNRTNNDGRRLSSSSAYSDEDYSDEEAPRTPVLQASQLTLSDNVNSTPSGHKQEPTDATIIASSSSVSKRDTIVPSTSTSKTS